jgi:hypothetical protein
MAKCCVFFAVRTVLLKRAKCLQFYAGSHRGDLGNRFELVNLAVVEPDDCGAGGEQGDRGNRAA